MNIGDDNSDSSSIPALARRKLTANRNPSLAATLGEDGPLHGRLEPRGLVLFERVQVVETTEEEEIRDLLDHLEWIGNTTCPKSIPNLINLILDAAGNH
jgi:hypothetical protein